MSAHNAIHTDDEILDARMECGSNAAAARKIGMDRRGFDRRWKRIAVRRGYAPKYGLAHPVADGQMLKGASTLTDLRTGERLLQWTKSTADEERRKALIEESYKAMIAEMKPLPARKRPKAATADDAMMVYPIGDPHVGMRAWAKECGADWDLAIAQGTHRIVVDDLIRRSPSTERALIVNLGDMLHYDSMMPVTARSGNMLDADGRYNKMIRIATEVMVQFIESALLRHDKVHVINAIGNHDETGAQWLALLLEHRYSKDKRITIDTSPSVFNYYRFDANLIGVHHGHTVRKIDALPGIMATDRAKEWGETKHRLWMTGHVHHEARREFPGCIVETFGTLATADAYAMAGGWRSRQNAYALCLHAEAGECARLRSDPYIAGCIVPKAAA